MTMANELLTDAFTRVRDTVHATVLGLAPEQAASRPEPHTNSVAWLVWHLTRIQDDHIADAAGEQQVWHTGGWSQRLALPLDDADTGFGHSPEQVAAVRVDPVELLTQYHDAVHERTTGYLAGLTEQAMHGVVDDRWDPPVTLAVRLVSVVNDDMQHAGQAAFLRGLLERT